MPQLDPIALFAYKRPAHLRAALESLEKNPEARDSELFVFCDGPRRPEDHALTEEVRAVARERNWCGRVHVIATEKNQGLRKSVVAGVSRLCREFGRVIVLEDDLLLSPHFLSFMNEALNRYADAPNVMQITGYNYPVPCPGSADAFFLVHSSCWGWGTWARAWEKLDPQPTELPRLQGSPELRHAFDMEGAYPYTALLALQAEGKVDSWGVLWYQTLFRLKGLTLMPRRTLVSNVGMDGSGTHGSGEGYDDALSAFRVNTFPATPTADAAAHNAISTYLRTRRPSVFRRAARALKQRWKRVFP